ncbi:MAG: decaprenyl-phosphate phosphoribosyltransferase [Micrococcales bacterium]
MKKIAAVLRLIRPKHWVKNLFVLAPLAFSGHFNEPDANFQTAMAFAVFCLVASATYVMNDIFDVTADRAHPVKRLKRPLAAGQLSVPSAWVIFAALIAISAMASLWIPKVLPVVALYFVIQIAYNFYLKRVPVIDMFVIAVGFVLRVYAGAFSIEVQVSKWMFVTTMSLALFLASMKRFQELKTHGSGARSVLGKYTIEFTQRISEISGTLAVVFYSFFCLTSRREFIYTIPVVVFVLVRYWYVADRSGEGESPTDLILRDKQLLVAAAALLALFALPLVFHVHLSASLFL